MAESRALLLIADIGGYTTYMSLHRVGLAHAQANIARLLEAVIDAAPRLELVEIEGDAVFLSRPADGDDAKTATDAALAMHRSFHDVQRLVVENLCPCEGCSRVGNLTIKFVAHVGDVVSQNVRNRKTLVGPDVILVHRLLKNTVPIPEYVLFSGDLYTGSDGVPLEQRLEGLGPVQTYFLDLSEIAEPLPPAPAPSLGRRVGETFGVLGRGMPFLLRLKRQHAEAH
jgi:class 3 adenylate cyclase